LAARAVHIFIGSSSEALGAAQAVRSLLATDAHITLWNEGFFRQGRGFLEALVASLGHLILLFSSRHPTIWSPREVGLF